MTMSPFQFTKATKKQLKLRLALAGPSGSGKTYSALSIAQHLGKRVAVIDTEFGSASLYADRFEFDALNLETFSPETYVSAIHSAEKAGYDVIVIDSLTHAWSGKDGALEQVDAAAKRAKGNSYVGWREVTPKHNALVDAMIACKAHVIGTMRSKSEYVLEDGPGGKKVPKKIGMAPIQREGMEYEFTVFGDLDLENNLVITKTRCSALAGKVYNKPGEQIATTLRAWLESGAPVAEVAKPVAAAPSTPVAQAPAPKPADTDRLPPPTPAAPAQNGAPLPSRMEMANRLRAAKTPEAWAEVAAVFARLPDAERTALKGLYDACASQFAKPAA